MLGIFIGLALGLLLASVVAWTLLGGRLPGGTATPKGETAARGDARAPKSDAADKPRFDFYKILPGAEEPKTAAKAPERAPADKADKATVAAARPSEPPAAPAAAAEPSAAKGAKASERFWLQVGSFAQAPDAEQLKARLALAGWEAQVQAGSLPDKGVRYRVRLGPYDNSDELNRVKNELGRRGFDAAVIKQ